MAFSLSKKSVERLDGVHEDLVAIVNEAILVSQHDFSVVCGVRTLKEQRSLVRRGLSQTMNSRHLTGHAVDLGAYSKGRITWDWPAYYMIADAMIRVCVMLDTPLRWGGAWHCRDLRTSDLDAESLSADYILKKTIRRR